MKYSVVGIVILGLCVVAVVGIGALLPVQHVAKREVELNASTKTVWDAVIMLFADEEKRDQEVIYETRDVVPEKKMVRKITNTDLPFGGQWTIDILEKPNGCVVRITENGEVYQPIYRFMSRFVFGHTASIDSYLKKLQSRLGETTVI